jgi:hypothetical protein
MLVVVIRSQTEPTDRYSPLETLSLVAWTQKTSCKETWFVRYVEVTHRFISDVDVKAMIYVVARWITATTLDSTGGHMKNSEFFLNAGPWTTERMA